MEVEITITQDVVLSPGDIVYFKNRDERHSKYLCVYNRKTNKYSLVNLTGTTRGGAEYDTTRDIVERHPNMTILSADDYFMRILPRI